jgi:glycosyltransferase involved in cell wall biosynthesis
MTWKDEYPAGVSTLNSVTVRRFPVDSERDHHRFNQTLGAILGGMPLAAYPQHQALMREAIARSPLEQQLACLKLQGPYSTPLLKYLAAHHQDYDLIAFFTYLYPTTFFGSRQVPAIKTVLIPTAHDEAPIYFPLFQEMFARFPAYVFLTPEERHLIEETFSINGALKATIGMPVELANQPDPLRFRGKYGIEGPFLLYAGRLDPSKGCDELFRFFRAARCHLPPDLKLVLIGSHMMDVPHDANIRYLGMLSEQDKADAMAAATVMVNPSPFESFSIVVLEAMLCGTPALVNGRCEVLKGHVRRSSGGLYYETYCEFVEVLRLLLGDETLRSRLGKNGAEYVKQNYRCEIVKRRYLALLDQVGARV